MKQFNIFKTPQRVWGKDVHGELPPRTKLPPEKIPSSQHQKHKRQLKKITKIEREKIRIGKFFSQGDFPGSIFFLKAVSPGDFFIEPPQRLILILIVNMYQPFWKIMVIFMVPCLRLWRIRYSNDHRSVSIENLLRTTQFPNQMSLTV